MASDGLDRGHSEWIIGLVCKKGVSGILVHGRNASEESLDRRCCFPVTKSVSLVWLVIADNICSILCCRR